MRLRRPALCALFLLATGAAAHAQTAPVFTLQPGSAATFVGEPLTLNVVAEGDAPITYQWHKNTLPIPGATTTVLTFSALGLGDTGVYYVVATNGVGATLSQTATVFVTKRAQTIAFNLPATTAPAGSSIALSATASSGLPVTLSLVSGAATLSGGLLTGNGGTVVVRATQAGNEFYAAADLIERTFSFVAGGLAPFFSSPPADQTVNAGATVTLRAAVIGTPGPALSWQKDGVAIAGATTGSLVIAAATLADSGRYTVTATNPSGSVSASATLTVRQAPVITTQPAGLTAPAGDRVTFSVVVTGFPAPAYQWRRNGTNIAGATRAEHVIPAVGATDAGRFDVVVTNAVGTVTSAAATLAVTTRDFSGTYLGQLAGDAGPVALFVRADRTAVLLAHATAAGAGVAATDVRIDLGGRFTADTTTLGAAPRAATVRGLIDEVAGTVTGEITGFAAAFAATRAPGTGAAAANAGFFSHGVTGTAAGRGHGIVAADGQAMILLLSGSAVDSARGTLSPAARLTVTTAAQATLDLAFNGGLFSGTLRTGTATSQLRGASEAQAAATRLINLSVRALTAPGATNLITGFVVRGAVPKQVMVRVVGPTLAGAPFNVAGVLPDPTLQLVRAGAVAGQNDDWGTPPGNVAPLTAAATRAGAFPLRPGSTDAALLASLPAAAYSVTAGGGTGTVLAEVYEVLDATEAAGARRLVNLAARGVTTPGAPLIAGFVISGTAPQRVLLRGVGPTLGAAPFGLAGALPNPELTLFRGTTTVKTNDDWFRDADAVLIRDAALRAGAFPLGATAADAAMLIFLEPGSYTVQVAAPAGAPAAGQTGLALVEIYEATP
ncbi:MAG: immunoglobulin domain-containing protein [Opitutaceae bacterium]|nr:immunoglobulin domain-containing protein [Opitutaceae bacterium]